MSEESILRAVDGASEVLAEDEDDALWQKCPVVCLGQRHGVYHFLAASGEKREYQVRDFSAMGLLSLFNGHREWLAAKFPVYDKSDPPQPTGDFTAKGAGAGLMRRCARAGLWNPATPIRGVGVWRDERVDEPVIVHCGDMLMVEQQDRLKFVAAGRHWGRAIYPAAPEAERPAATPASAAQIAVVLGQLRLWNVDHPKVPELVLGLIALAALGAAPQWRVHGMITAARGGGKSALARYILRLLGAQGASLNDFTEAGLRQTFTGTGLAYVLDEAEEDVGHNRIEQVIQFLRRMSGEEGLQSVRGGATGTPQSFSAASPAILSAINPPTMLPQDRSRFLEIELGQANAKNRGAVLAAIEAATVLSPAFRARAVLGWARYRQNLALYHDALIRMGCDPRQADKFGALLAASDMILHDDPIDAKGAEGAVASIADIVSATIAEDEEASDSRQCLGTLLSRQIEHWRGGSKSTIGRLVFDVLSDSNNHEASNALKVYGLRLIRQTLDDGKLHWWLFVANRHEGLISIFRDTRWRNGAWKTSLLRLEDAKRSAVPIRFDGSKERAVQIPERHLPMPPPAPSNTSRGGDRDDPFGEQKEGDG